MNTFMIFRRWVKCKISTSASKLAREQQNSMISYDQNIHESCVRYLKFEGRLDTTHVFVTWNVDNYQIISKLVMMCITINILPCDNGQSKHLCTYIICNYIDHFSLEHLLHWGLEEEEGTCMSLNNIMKEKKKILKNLKCFQGGLNASQSKVFYLQSKL